MAKPKVALYWCASCGGCEESVVDLAEEILTVVGAVDIVFWPVAIDTKYQDVEALKDGELAAALINGAVRTDEQEHLACLLRKKSKIVIAHGSCAHLGGVVGLANFYSADDTLARAYTEVPSLRKNTKVLPQKVTDEKGKKLTLPGFHNTVKTLDQVIKVDYYIPGCPPPPELIATALGALIEGKLPPPGSVIAEKKALCETCSRLESKPEKITTKKFKRLYETDWDPERCFLESDIICVGPATRGGCGERCIKANMPCRGCFGPTDEVSDQGAKILSFLASLMDETDEVQLKEIAESIPDLAGLCYRYCLAASILGGKRPEINQTKQSKTGR